MPLFELLYILDIRSSATLELLEAHLLIPARSEEKYDTAASCTGTRNDPDTTPMENTCPKPDEPMNGPARRACSSTITRASKNLNTSAPLLSDGMDEKGGCGFGGDEHFEHIKEN